MGSGNLKEVLVFHAVVVSVKEKHEQRWVSGQGDNAEFSYTTKGWYVGLEGSHELLYAGMVKPNIEVGDKARVEISFREP